MITTLTPLSSNQGKLYAKAPDADRINEQMLADIGFRLGDATRTSAVRPTFRARLAGFVSWAIPLGRVSASAR